MQEHMNNEEKFNISLNFLTHSLKFLSLVTNVLEECAKQGNLHFLSEKEISWEEFSWEKYHQITKWSDFNIFPILFNFYHGLELLMKGFLILVENYNLKPAHNFEKLFKSFKSYYPSQAEILRILTKYLEIDSMPAILSEWLKDNTLTITQLHQFLEYPFNVGFSKNIDYSKLKYREEKGLELVKEIVRDIEVLQIEVVKLYRSLEKEK